MFVPEYKWGPLSFMKLTHEAFKGALPRMAVAVKDLADGGANDDAVAAVRWIWGWGPGAGAGGRLGFRVIQCMGGD